MFIIINIIGLLLFVGLAVLCSKNRKDIKWYSIGTMLVVNLIVSWLLTGFPIGRDIVLGCGQRL